MKIVLMTCVMVTGILPAQEATPANSRPASTSWRALPLWDIGRAEFSAYEVSWQRYGARRKARALIVLVKEPWAPDLDVKADTPREQSFDVLKLNHIRDARTGIYRYHQMASAFIRRDDGRLRKMATSSTEACGITTTDLRGGVLSTRSYFDRQGDRQTAWKAGAIPVDALPMLGRDLVQAGKSSSKTVDLFPSLLNGRLPPLKARAWTVSRRELGEVETPGLRCKATEVRLVRGRFAHRLVFEARTPHRLLTWEQPDGTSYRLAKTELLEYWEKTAPGDASWWPEHLR